VNESESVVLAVAIVIGGGLAVLWMALRSRWHARELEHRERLAMIERGLVPPPEVDPQAFENRFGAMPAPESPAVSRTRSAGIMLIGLGLALTFLISFAGRNFEQGLGVGGAFALLGAAFVANAAFMKKSGSVHESRRPPAIGRRPEPRPPSRDEPSDRDI
jgi:hypothetical protein